MPASSSASRLMGEGRELHAVLEHEGHVLFLESRHDAAARLTCRNPDKRNHVRLAGVQKETVNFARAAGA